MQCALFNLIWPDGPRTLERKITASNLAEEMNTDFKISVFSNFLIPRSSPVRYQKPIKHFNRLCFGPLNMRRTFSLPQISHQKNYQHLNCGNFFSTYTKNLRPMWKKIKPPMSRQVSVWKPYTSSPLFFCPHPTSTAHAWFGNLKLQRALRPRW